MTYNGPQTSKGNLRKLWSGDGRKSTPGERFDDATRVQIGKAATRKRKKLGVLKCML
jgi:hypothetical protein